MRPPIFAAWGLAAVVAAACGARSELDAPFVYRPLDEEPQGGGPPECVVYQSSAQLAALDVFVMLDTSGSMSELTAGGTKWNSVRLALSAFFHAPESAGIGVSLGYFPAIGASPTECSESQPCAAGGICVFNKVCGDSFEPCIDQANCVAKGVGDKPCVPVGVCPDAQACVPDVGIGCAMGSCALGGLCDNDLGCDPATYATPAVEVSRLPEDASKLLANLNQQTPGGATPTVPALMGVTELATGWLDDNPEHEVIVVLATDGQPSACGSTQLPNDELVATAASANASGVRTFVIGVFGVEEAEEAKVGLDNIALAGGSEEAFVIDTSQQVDAAFLEALNEIRLDAKACEFGLQIDEPIDFDEVWVKISSEDGEEVWVPLVDGAGACAGGGFYYDPPPTPETAFLNIVLCPETCTLLGASPDRRAEIFTECPGAGM